MKHVLDVNDTDLYEMSEEKRTVLKQEFIDIVNKHHLTLGEFSGAFKLAYRDLISYGEISYLPND